MSVEKRSAKQQDQEPEAKGTPRRARALTGPTAQNLEDQASSQVELPGSGLYKGSMGFGVLEDVVSK